MRRLAALLMLSLILAAPAGAQEARRIQVVKESPAPGALRGTAPEAQDAQVGADTLAALIPLPPPVAPVGSKVSTGPRQCRASCSREYYFCLSSGEETCPQTWTKCASGCGT